MIKPIQLRLGNYVKYGSEIIEVTGIFYDVIHDVNTLYLEHELDPIPMTEHWLLKFGFKRTDYKDPDGNFHVCHRLHADDGCLGAVFEYDDDGGMAFTHFESGFDNKDFFAPDCDIVQYVHQFQNIYFALMGEELTIKERVL